MLFVFLCYTGIKWIGREKKMQLKKIFEPTITWFQANKTPLPWRETKDPYRIWLSEVMLQQTRIEAVIPYYHRFLGELPDVFALASCSEEKLLKLWEGLGYYSRARNLKKAAEIIVSELGGSFPREEKSLRALPGIGEYTAGAIASIAFGQPSPAVDGNVMRVVTRFCADRSDIALPATKKKITDYLRKDYPSGASSALFTEGIMELGERICLPNGKPLCESCPLKEACLAHRLSCEEDFPVKSKKASRRIEKKTVLLLQKGEKFALRRRPKNGLLASLWEWVNFDGECSEKEIEEELKKLGLCVEACEKIGSSRHVFTHIEWEMTGFLVHVSGENSDLIWSKPSEIEKSFAIPTAFRAFTKKIFDPPRSGSKN